ncbi:MAG: M48 family metallopeptidase [bacterium]|nr:M48 family metallopeptidase [bacterium]
MTPKRIRPLRAAAAAALMAVFLAACYTNPFTHRRELMLVTPQEEAQLGLNTFNQIKNETPVSTDPAQNDLVQRVGRRISSVVDLPYAQWEFVMFRADQTANAFCLPAGKVGVYTGILPITQSEAGLATVIGHEVAHAAARHGGERMSHALLVQLGGITLSAALQSKPQQTQDLALTAYGVGTALGHSLPHSRKQELEADQMGLMFMARAGYDPREAISFWQRFQQWSNAHGGQPPEFLSTHPLDSRRIRELEKHLPEALAAYQGRNP